MFHGVINIYKEPGFTSHDVVAKLRGILRQKKIGHTGTLDPAAEGVLPVCLGKGTKLCDLLTDKRKTYQAVLLLGTETDTQDTTGTILSEKPTEQLTEPAVRGAAESFVGPYMQVPPMYSALKVNGKKLYELARKGREVERKPRSITIFELELLEQVSETDYLLRCRCSKGTYLRTLCHDIGQALGCGGAMYSLRRTMAAGYPLAEAVTLEDVQAQGEALLRPVESMFTAYPVHTLSSPGKEARVRNGNPITEPELPDGTYRVHSRSGDFLCLSRAECGTLTSIKNFFGA